MLGRDLVGILGRRGEDVTGLRREELDVTDSVAVRACILRARPAVVVNCAAWTAVDEAEAREDEALEINGRGPENVAAACAASGSRLVQVSTDYVFAGDGSAPYAEYDRTGPRTAYGRTKLAGEQAVLRLLPETGYVVRTAWLYGEHGPSFVRAMTDLEGRRPFVDVVADQRGQPTWTADVADQIVALVRAAPRAGIYHATSSGEATWHELAVEVFRLLGADPARVRATTSAAFPRPAPRPAYSVLAHNRHAAAGIEPIGDWRTALSQAWPVLGRAWPVSGRAWPVPTAGAGSRAVQPRGVGQASGVAGE
jgi:dTDP-4-dehydrorhamnose reductase